MKQALEDKTKLLVNSKNPKGRRNLGCEGQGLNGEWLRWWEWLGGDGI